MTVAQSSAARKLQRKLFQRDEAEAAFRKAMTYEGISAEATIAYVGAIRQHDEAVEEVKRAFDLERGR
jgi:DNA topoisomerase VI subunit B